MTGRPCTPKAPGTREIADARLALSTGDDLRPALVQVKSIEAARFRQEMVPRAFYGADRGAFYPHAECSRPALRRASMPRKLTVSLPPLAPATSLQVTATPSVCDGVPCGLVNIDIERGENWGTYVVQGELTVVVDGVRGPPIAVSYKDPHRPTFELVPGEKTHYGAIVELPRAKPVIIEALFVMQQAGWFSAYRAYVFASTAVKPSP